MNERIKKLVKRAGGHISMRNLASNPVQHIESIELWDKNIEKFAELIVRECATAFEAEVDSWKEMDPYQGSIKRQGTKAIKKHFGVEE